MTSGACPICRAALTEGARATAPFCSARCRQIDLGKWLNEDYRVAVDSDDGQDADPESSPPAGSRGEPS